jgi:[ribosomal protein S18]-alanine N-acetyltransferase
LILIPALVDDLPDLLAIESASFAQPWSKGSFLSELRKPLPSLYVLRRQIPGCILGYICFWLVAEEIQMLNLAVHPDYRRQGLGRQLMTFLLSQARENGISKVFLEVRPSNRAAIALYVSFGFKILYRRPGYYAKEREDALVMEWSGEDDYQEKSKAPRMPK